MSAAQEKKSPAHMARRIVCVACVILLLAFSYTAPGKSLWHTRMQACGLVHFTQDLPENALHIHVIDVGKADAILLESPKASVLVDCGTADKAEDILRYLDARDIERLDAVWISHPDTDHRGGLETILETVSVDDVVESRYAEHLEDLTDLTRSTVLAGTGDRFDYGDFVFEVLAPDRAYLESNDASIVFRLRYGTFSMLFCGDIAEAGEQALLESGADLRADALKVAHHGSDSSTSTEFLQAVQPQYAVISSGYDRNMLPRSTVLKRLDAVQAEVFRTDTDGTVVLSVLPDELMITTENAGRVV